MTESIGMRKKICLLGDPGVGKTSLIRKYAYNQFSSTYISTIGTEVTKKELNLNFVDNRSGNRHYELSFAIWDIIGQKEYRTLISRFYKNASGALLVCDFTREETLQHLREWTTSLFGAIGKIPIIFVGNKYDLMDKKGFNPDELLEYSCRFGAPWIMTSAKNGENVQEAFVKLGDLIIKSSLFFERMNTLIDVLDAIIVDFCEVAGGLEIGMPIFKDEFTKIPRASLREPDKEVVEELISGLTRVTRNTKGREIANYQHSRFINWLEKETNQFRSTPNT